MGIDLPTLRFLLLARSRGASFAETMTLGRQDVLLEPREIADCLRGAGTAVSIGEARSMIEHDSRFAEPLLGRLGARVADSMDRSSYEGATVVHDLNDEIPAHLAGRYSFVLDGGTLEHVFDVRSALGNAMRMVRVGGHLVTASPANNFMGHGFYQFGPDLLYRTLSPENGFRIELMLLTRQFEDAAWYRVRDPAAVRTRVGHNSGRWPLSLFVLATRVADVPVFRTAPQQSDYAAEWRDRADKAHDPSRLSFYTRPRSRRVSWALRTALRRGLPRWAFDLLRCVVRIPHDISAPDPVCFEPFDVTPRSR